MCVTPSQNYCFALSMGNASKSTIVITARQHPGETGSNFVFEGIMDYLCQNKELLEQFEFMIIPMINIDGCIYGNFRSNLTGVDLNRMWTDPDKLFTPEVQSIKTYLRELSRVKKISHFIDLHGHSRELGTFIYSSGKGKRSKLLPYLLGDYSESFDRSKCTFGICPSKEDTARANISDMLGCKCQSITI
jgi:hypothetical protein